MRSQLPRSPESPDNPEALVRGLLIGSSPEPHEDEANLVAARMWLASGACRPPALDAMDVDLELGPVLVKGVPEMPGAAGAMEVGGDVFGLPLPLNDLSFAGASLSGGGSNGGTPTHFDSGTWRRSLQQQVKLAMAEPKVPMSLRAMGASSARDISVAARVHRGATVAILFPSGIRIPLEHELETCGLKHPPDIRGWYPLTDGSHLGLVQLDNSVQRVRRSQLGDEDSAWVNHGQARALYHINIRTLKLMELYVPAKAAHTLRTSPQSECADLLARLLPGFRYWPLSDVLVSRVIAWNVASERCRAAGNLCRLDRGERFLDLARLHYGEEVAFLFAWQSNYLYMLAGFVFLSFPFIIFRTWRGKGYIDHSLFPNAMLSIVFGVLVTTLWDKRVRHLVHRWHEHGDSTTRWHHIVGQLLASQAKVEPPSWENVELSGGLSDKGSEAGSAASVSSSEARPGVEPWERPRSRRAISLSRVGTGFMPGGALERFESSAESGMQAIRTALGWDTLKHRSRRDRLKRILKAGLVIPIILAEWACILLFFTVIVWFEIWVIFDWGGCREYNLAHGGAERSEEWRCLSADQLRGWPGVVMGALPSICEGVFFELLLLVSKLSAQMMIGLFRFNTREQQDFAAVLIVFFLEVTGKVGFISVLGLGFVPAWEYRHWTECRNNWDYAILGDWSLGCLKGQIPFEVRLKLFESCMKGPMLVSGMISILIKTLLPVLLEWWRRGIEYYLAQRCFCCAGRRYLLVRILLAPTDFVLRTTLLIFQADFGAVGGLRILCSWPPRIEKDAVAQGSLASPTRMTGFGRAGADGELISSTPDKLTMAAEERMRVRQARLQDILLEGDRREHQPFDEYIELLLHFLWTSCFAIVWPLGTVFALCNQLLEFRFDCVKLLVVRRRRFPSSRHMSVAWVPQCAAIVCHISILVNVLLLLLPYRQLIIWFPEGCSEDLTLTARVGLNDCTLPKIAGAFGVTWAVFLIIRFIVRAVILHVFLKGKEQGALARLCRPLAKRCVSGSGEASPDRGSPEEPARRRRRRRRPSPEGGFSGRSSSSRRPRPPRPAEASPDVSPDASSPSGVPTLPSSVRMPTWSPSLSASPSVPSEVSPSHGSGLSPQRWRSLTEGSLAASSASTLPLPAELSVDSLGMRRGKSAVRLTPLL